MLFVVLISATLLLPLLLPLLSLRSGSTGNSSAIGNHSPMPLPPILMHAFHWNQLPGWADSPLCRLRFAAELKWEEYVLPIRILVRTLRFAASHHAHDFKSVAVLHLIWDGGLLALVFSIAHYSHGLIGVIFAAWMLMTFLMSLAKEFSSGGQGHEFSEIDITLAALREFAILRVLGRGILVIVAFGALYFSLSQMNPSMFSQPITAFESIYLSVVTFGTVGYGDISPHHPVARGACCLEVVFGFVFTGLVVTSLISRARKRDIGDAHELFGGPPTDMGL